jgi:hypothetical protein
MDEVSDWRFPFDAGVRFELIAEELDFVTHSSVEIVLVGSVMC